MPRFGTEVVEYDGGHAVLQGLEVEVLDYADYLGGHVIALMSGEFQAEAEEGVFGHEGLVDDKCAVGVQVVRLGEVAAFCYFHPEERDEVGVYGEAVHILPWDTTCPPANVTSVMLGFSRSICLRVSRLFPILVLTKNSTVCSRSKPMS